MCVCALDVLVLAFGAQGTDFNGHLKQDIGYVGLFRSGRGAWLPKPALNNSTGHVKKGVQDLGRFSCTSFSKRATHSSSSLVSLIRGR